MAFSCRPWQFFDFDPTDWTLHPPWSVEEKDWYGP
jgi:hypothetical protein